MCIYIYIYVFPIGYSLLDFPYSQLAYNGAGQQLPLIHAQFGIEVFPMTLLIVWRDSQVTPRRDP